MIEKLKIDEVDKLFKRFADLDDSYIEDVLEDYVESVRQMADCDKDSHNLFTDSVTEQRLNLFCAIVARTLFDEGDYNINTGDVYIVIKHVDIILKEFPDLLTAPASTAYHGDWEGGLIDHSIAVYLAALNTKKAYKLIGNEKKAAPYRLNPLFFIFHDLCKCICYEKINKNVKNPDTGKWETKLAYSTMKSYESVQHGPESVMRIYRFILKYPEELDWISNSFTDCWVQAVSYHMGMYNMCDGEMVNYGNAKRRYPEVLHMHHADMIASQIWKI